MSDAQQEIGERRHDQEIGQEHLEVVPDVPQRRDDLGRRQAHSEGEHVAHNKDQNREVRQLGQEFSGHVVSSPVYGRSERRSRALGLDKVSESADNLAARLAASGMSGKFAMPSASLRSA